MLVELLLLFVAVTSKLHHVSLSEANQLRINNKQGLFNKPASQAVGLPSGRYPYYFFTQKRDHFNPQDNNTWQQLYYVDSRFYKDGGPIFLELGGEAPLGQYYADFSLISEMAKRYGGLHIGLEHRYYGKGTSQPVANLTVNDYTPANLKWLTVDQVLADTAEFIKGYNSSLVNNKWITIGGSYAGNLYLIIGNLAAWMRLKYPDLVFAAHSSSAPLNAVEDFWQYGYGVDIGLAKSGGSQVCEAGWRRAVGLFDDFIASNSASVVLSAVGAPPNLDVRDLAGVSTNFATLVQYGVSDYVDLGDFNYTKSVTYVCSGNFVPAFINPKSSDAELLADYIQFIKIKYPTPQSFSKLDTLTSETNPSLKLWTWQICRDFGYFQVYTTQSPTAYSRYLTVDYFHWLCNVTFNTPNFRPNVSRINSEYLGLGIYTATTRIVFVNGDTDPYSFLSITSNNVQISTNPGSPGPNFELPNIVITNGGGRHCQDLALPSDGSSPSFIETHSKILQSWDLYINFNPNLPNGGTIPNYSATTTTTASTTTADPVATTTSTTDLSLTTPAAPLPSPTTALPNLQTGLTSAVTLPLTSATSSPTLDSLIPQVTVSIAATTLSPVSPTVPLTTGSSGSSTLSNVVAGTSTQTVSTTPSYTIQNSITADNSLPTGTSSSSTATQTDQVIIFPNFTVPGQTATLGGFSFIFKPTPAANPVNNPQC
ncbi:hypothetical protein HDV06_006687 [Boothiomyces sp. JEL0866]|nr:hypothetical protein HDV06_006687 [Boothiomyces sp. JEL0866]